MNPLIRAAAALVASAAASSAQAVPITWEITGTVNVLSNLGAWNVDPALGTLRIGDPFSVLYTFDDAAEGVAGTDQFGSDFIDYANAVQEMQIGIGSLSYFIEAQPVGSLGGSFITIGQASISQDGEVVEYDSSWFARARQPVAPPVGDVYRWIQADFLQFWDDPLFYQSLDLSSDPQILLTGEGNPQFAFSAFECTIASFSANRCNRPDGRDVIGGSATQIRRVTSVPEPSTLALFGVGMLTLIAFVGRRPQRRQ